MTGKIITMGGNVEISPTEPLFKEFFNISQLISDGQPTIGIIPTPSAEPFESGKIYSRLFNDIGANTIVLNPEDRHEANSEGILNDVEKAHSFFITGGNQLRITGLLAGTDTVRMIKKKFQQGALVGGTSAGAVCLTNIMIFEGSIKRHFYKGEVDLTQGLGFIDEVVIDTHFAERGRFPRLIQVVSENPGILGIGLGEKTGAVWDFDKIEFEVIGSGNVVAIEGRHLTKTNIPELEVGDNMSVSGIRVHVLGHGSRFQYEKCDLYLPEDED
ncbi:MAG: cyanophycinase [Candidatus Saliniplasma sp.]